VANVEVRLAEQKSTLEQLKDKEKQDVDSLRAADKAVTDAVKAISKADDSKAALGKKVEHVSASITTFQGAMSAASDKKTIGSLIGELKACGVEESLLKAAPSALGLEPAARGDFDNMCVTTIASKLEQHRDSLAAQAGQADTDKLALEASLVEKNTLKAQLEQASEQSTGASELAAKACKDVEVELKSAKQIAKTAGDGNSKAQKEVDNATKSVAEFDVVFDAFVTLKDRGNKPADWRDTSDGFGGFKEIAFSNGPVALCVSKTEKFDPMFDYNQELPEGWKWATVAEKEAVCNGETHDTTWYSGQAGWGGYNDCMWKGQYKRYFTYADSATNGGLVKASNKEGNINVPYFTAAEVKKLTIDGHDIHEAAKCKDAGIVPGHGRFAGIVCVKK